MSIKSRLKAILNNFLNKIDITIERKSNFDKLIKNQDLVEEFGLLKYIKDPKNQYKFIKNLIYSKSQLKQDLFVLSQLEFKKNGFFVEFGATDGLDLSNTFILEKRFDWNGILVEPGLSWHKTLKKNRDVIIDKNCIWKESGKKLIFNETNKLEFSTIDEFTSSDSHKSTRKNGRKYEVKTISLEELLLKYNAPRIIDYLSIDTEGSEFSILENFNFNKFKFKIITIEHNYTKMREKIYRLLIQKGYVRKFEDLSRWDDWYILN